MDSIGKTPIDESIISRAKSINDISILWKNCTPDTKRQLVHDLAMQTIRVLTSELGKNKEIDDSDKKKIELVKNKIGNIQKFLGKVDKKTEIEDSTDVVLTRINESISSIETFTKEKKKIKKLLESASADNTTLLKVADGLIRNFKSSLIENGELVYYAIKLYEKAALNYQHQGQLQEAIEIRKKIADPDLILTTFPLKKMRELSKHSATMDHPILGTIDFGMTCSEIDSGLLKGGNIQVREFILDGQKKKEVSFKLNYWAADRLRENMMAFKDPNASQMLQKNGLCHGVTVNETDYFYYYPKSGKEFTETGKQEMGSSANINLHGLASISIGNDPLMGSMYNRVTIDLKSEATVLDLQKALALSGLGELTTNSDPEDIERLKINTLFHHYFPRESFVLERKEEFYKLSLDQLKALMIHKCPQMKEILEKKLSGMMPYEITPGEMRFLIPGIAEETKNLGARGLIAGTSGNVTTAAKCVACILQSGFISSQARFHNGLLLGGASSKDDHERNSADSVYMRAVTQKAIDDKTSIARIPLSGLYQIMCKLNLLDAHPYVHKIDFYGCRNPHSPGYGTMYTTRPSLLEHIITNQNVYEESNEVMFKSRVDASYIAGVTYQDPRRKLIADITAKNPAFFPVGLSDTQKMDYVEASLNEVENELSTYAGFKRDPKTNESSYQRLSIKNHWILNPKKILIEELKKIGYKNEFNMINFDDLIKEKTHFDDEMFHRCHENV